MHKVVTKEWRKTGSAETSQHLVFCFSCRDNSMAWVPCPSDNVWYKYIWTCLPIFFAGAYFYEEKSESENMLISILKKVQSWKMHKSTLRPPAPHRRAPASHHLRVHAAPLGQPKYYRSIPGHVRSRVTRPIREMPCAPSHNTNMWTLCVKKALKTLKQTNCCQTEAELMFFGWKRLLKTMTFLKIEI